MYSTRSGRRKQFQILPFGFPQVSNGRTQTEVELVPSSSNSFKVLSFVSNTVDFNTECGHIQRFEQVVARILLPASYFRPAAHTSAFWPEAYRPLVPLRT